MEAVEPTTIIDAAPTDLKGQADAATENEPSDAPAVTAEAVTAPAPEGNQVERPSTANGGELAAAESVAAPQSVDGSAPESTGEAPAPAIDHATGEETPADGQVEAEVRHDVVTEEPQVDAAAETATTSAVASPAASTQKRNLLENTEWRVELTYGNIKKVEAPHPYLEACRMLETVPSSKFIKQMNTDTVMLKHGGLGPKGARAIAIAILPNMDMRNLDLTACDIGVEGGTAIGEMLHRNRSLASLVLADNGIGEGATTIADGLVANKSLTTLSLRGNGIADAEAVAFANMLKSNRQLTCLDLSHNNIGDVGGTALGHALSANDSLKELNLAWNNMRPQGVQAVMAGIKENPSVYWLNIGWNGISDAVASNVSQTIAKSNFLSYLNLSNCRITEAGAATIAKGLEVNGQLQELIMDNNAFADAGAILIVKAATQCETLTKLSMKGIKYNKDTRSKIAELLQGARLILIE